MIDVVRGDLFASGADVLVNPVNCVGVSGAGLAAAFKAHYPSNHASYAAACARGNVQLGRVYVVPLACGPVIANFPTKHRWRDRSRLSDIESGLRALYEALRFRVVDTVAMPALGCGLGELALKDVLPLISKAFSDSELHVTVYLPVRAASTPTRRR